MYKTVIDITKIDDKNAEDIAIFLKSILLNENIQNLVVYGKRNIISSLRSLSMNKSLELKEANCKNLSSEYEDFDISTLDYNDVLIVFDKKDFPNYFNVVKTLDFDGDLVTNSSGGYWILCGIKNYQKAKYEIEKIKNEFDFIPYRIYYENAANLDWDEKLIKNKISPEDLYNFRGLAITDYASKELILRLSIGISSILSSKFESENTETNFLGGIFNRGAFKKTIKKVPPYITFKAKLLFNNKREAWYISTDTDLSNLSSIFNFIIQRKKID